MKSKKFIHLHVHSDYSIINGLSKPEDLVKKAVSLKMMAIAITDFNNLYGVIKFYKSAHQHGLKPIIGATVNFFSELIKNELMELTILAATKEGYKNLILLISRAYKKGFSCEKHITIKKEWLSELNNGLILLSGGCQGEIGKVLLRGRSSLISTCLRFYNKYFSGFYYLELMRTDRENEEKYLHLATDLSYSKNIPVVATNDVCFLNKEDFTIHKIRIAINEGMILKESKIQNNYSKHQFLKTQEEMSSLFSDIPEAIINSIEISKRCNVFIESGTYFLPKFNTGKESIENYLITLAQKGLKKRLTSNFLQLNKEVYFRYENRLHKELKIINNMGFPSYFLIVMEFIKWAKDHNIPVGPGRGSGAGSLVAYALEITEVDPLFFDLLFERFLNPERISLPDFDIDFCMEKRDQVIEHVIEMYGREAVSQIITFGTMTAKAVIRDVGRVLGYPYGFVNNLSKLVPLDPGIKLKDAFSIGSELYNLYKNDEDIKKLIDISKRLEGINRNVGKHAGGVVISPTRITDFCPVYCDEKGNNPITQFDKNDIEYVGLLKFDFLGLRTLTTISYAVDMINKNRLLNKKRKININKILLNDKKCFHLLKKCETTAIFQLESYGMKDLIKRLQPDCFEDIVALIALFRPGPLQSGMVDNFINRKHGYEDIAYPDHKWQHLSLKPILYSTYGIILYQEQVMQIAQVLSGYTLGKADILRRAMSKKNAKDMAKQRYIFIEGAKKNGINTELSIKIFDLLEKFSGYGFNKSHSVAYAMVSYQTLWLKSHYPAEFMSSTMTSDIDNTEKIVILINESIRMGIKIIPPNINLSKYEFYVDDKKSIVYGLGAIKGIGENSIRNIIQEREKNGFFCDLFDLCIRTDPNKVTRTILEKLIMSGSCDCFKENRGNLLSLIEDAIKAAKEHSKTKKFKQESLFGSFKEELNILKNKSTLLSSISYDKNKLENEYKVLGFYLTEHPIDRYSEELKHYIHKLTLFNKESINKNRKKTIIAGIVVSVKIKLTKNNNRIAILVVDNKIHRLEVVVFQDLLKKFENLLKLNEILIIIGILDLNFIKNKILKMTAYDIMNLNLARKKYVNTLKIILHENKADKFILKKFYHFFNKQRVGKIPVHMLLKKENIYSEEKLLKTWLVTINNKFLVEFHALVDTHKICVKYI